MPSNLGKSNERARDYLTQFGRCDSVSSLIVSGFAHASLENSFAREFWRTKDRAPKMLHNSGVVTQGVYLSEVDGMTKLPLVMY